MLFRSASVVQLSNIQGNLIGPGAGIQGNTTGNVFVFKNVFDSRVASGQLSYGDIATVTNALVTDSGDYITIPDYLEYVFNSVPTMNLTASVITT